MDIIRALGVDTSGVRVSGGGGRSPLWRQLQADMFGCEVQVINSSEGPALGVALLAGVGTGLYKNVAEACDTAIKVTKIYKANEECTRTYLKNHMLYKELYEALKDKFKKN
jgi:xylulokinase